MPHKKKSFIKRIFPIIVFAVVGLLGMVFYGLFQESICVFFRFFGIPSPACGMTRAYFSLMRFDIFGAFWFHPLFWMPPVICVLYFFDKLSNKLLIIFIVLLLLVWLVRLFFMLPNQIEPMVFNENGILWRIFRFFTS